MATVNSISFYPYKQKASVSINLKPAGTHLLDINIPAAFRNCILNLAQSAADHHEQLCIAELLAKSKESDAL